MKHSCTFLKIPFFCAMWVRWQIFLFLNSHLYRSLLAFQPSKQSTAVRESKLWENQSPEGHQLDAVRWSRGLSTKICAELTVPLLLGTRFSPAVFFSPSPSIIGVIQYFMGVWCVCVYVEVMLSESEAEGKFIFLLIPAHISNSVEPPNVLSPPPFVTAP